MSLSVVIPTFNQRSALADCLRTLGERTTETEVVVVNGPSTDGTSGMVHERGDVDVLVELSSRNVNVARNVGIVRAQGEVIALLDPRHLVAPDWQEAIERNLAGTGDAISGPIRGDEDVTGEGRPDEPRSTQGAVTAGNLATTRGVLVALDGFDEYLDVGGMLDFARRLRYRDFRFIWHPDMAVERVGGEASRAGGDHDVDRAWFDEAETDWGRLYRSLTYRAIKNEGPRPGAVGAIVTAAVMDGIRQGRRVLTGHANASWWYRNGWSVVRNAGGGTIDGLRARRADRTQARNPHGISNSAGADVVVDEYDWR